MSNIAVIGSGYVGLTTAACFAYHGHKVIGVDINQERVENLNKGVIPIFEEGLEDLVVEGLKNGNLSFTLEADLAVASSEFVFLCLPTPQKEDGSADLSYVQTAIENIAKHISPNSIVVNKSTVPIGSVRKVAKMLKDHGAPEKINVVSNPEFLRESIAVRDALNPGRIVIGCDSADASVRVSELYRLFKAPTVLTDPESAEMIKYASNAFLACKISFINEMSRVADAFDADIKEVARGMGFDTRIGSQFLEPGPGYGGSCFPKDTSALLYSAAQKDVDVPVIRATIESNHQQFDHVIDIVNKATKSLNKDISEAKIGVWGLAFKSGTDDVRESPACEVVRRLVNAGASVKAYDPQANDNARKVLENVEILEDKYDVVQDSDLLIVLTEWDEFIDADYSKVLQNMDSNIVFDARNVLDFHTLSSTGFKVYGIGRHQ
ncbi:MAG: UDP-glucose/GDP-mannose dehydrogenase family protein [Acidimicrobiia bacterium]